MSHTSTCRAACITHTPISHSTSGVRDAIISQKAVRATARTARSNITDMLLIKKTTKGRGVFATRNIRSGEHIETCPAIVLSRKDRKLIDKTSLYDYYFSWSGGQAAIGLGYSSLYNHSYRPNATYVKDFKKRTITYICRTPIKKNEEIRVNYNGDPQSQEKVWFER
jgi:uncharacterized protein